MLKTSLQSCKNLLRCKREELKRLWLEDVKYKHMLKMIDALVHVRELECTAVEHKSPSILEYIIAFEHITYTSSILEYGTAVY